MDLNNWYQLRVIARQPWEGQPWETIAQHYLPAERTWRDLPETRRLLPDPEPGYGYRATMPAAGNGEGHVRLALVPLDLLKD